MKYFLHYKHLFELMVFIVIFIVFFGMGLFLLTGGDKTYTLNTSADVMK